MARRLRYVSHYAAPHPVQEHYRIQARRRTLLTVVMVFLAVATAVWSGLARRGSSNIDLKSSDPM